MREREKLKKQKANIKTSLTKISTYWHKNHIDNYRFVEVNKNFQLQPALENGNKWEGGYPRIGNWFRLLKQNPKRFSLNNKSEINKLEYYFTV